MKIMNEEKVCVNCKMYYTCFDGTYCREDETSSYYEHAIMALYITVSIKTEHAETKRILFRRYNTHENTLYCTNTYV